MSKKDQIPEDESKLTPEDKKKIIEAMDSLPEMLSRCIMGVIMIPATLKHLFKEDPETKYRIKFTLERVLESSKDLNEQCEKILKDIQPFM